QCKKQTIVATSSTEAEYVAAANCYGQAFDRPRSPELGPSAILTTIDETPYTITKDSVRSQLQLADDGGTNTSMVDRQDLLKLYGMVVTYYENHLVAGAGLMLWGDIQVFMDSQEGGKGSFVWNHQPLWQIRSWRLYTLSNVHVLETVSGEIMVLFAQNYRVFHSPMLHLLRVEMLSIHGSQGLPSPEQTATAEVVPESVAGSSFPAASSTLYLYEEIQICAEVSCVQVKTQVDWMLLYVVPTSRVVVPTGRYIVPASKVIIIVSTGRLSLVPTGNILSPGSKDLSRVGSNIYYERGDKVIFDEKKLGSS
ncbi:hypothetical protein Tco_0128534, partial [Tanacetum coccineum]